MIEKPIDAPTPKLQLPPMVEKNFNSLSIQNNSIAKTLSAQNQNYLTTAMLLGTQNCDYLGQRLQNHLRERDGNGDKSDSISSTNHQLTATLGSPHQQQQSNKHQMPQQQQQKQHPDQRLRNISSSSMSTSLFTIDSILASKPIDIKSEYTKSDSRSPSNSPPLSSTSSPLRPTRVPAMLHPGLHLSHLAAAAATGFGSPSDFLGSYWKCSEKVYLFFEALRRYEKFDIHATCVWWSAYAWVVNVFISSHWKINRSDRSRSITKFNDETKFTNHLLAKSKQRIKMVEYQEEEDGIPKKRSPLDAFVFFIICYFIAIRRNIFSSPYHKHRFVVLSSTFRLCGRE